MHLPVFLGRRPDEPVDGELRAFYELLLAFLGDEVVRVGAWARAGRGGWDGNETWRQLVGWGWRGDLPRKLVVEFIGTFIFVFALPPWNWHLFDLSRIDSPTAGQPG